ncbi:magnesium transporter [Egbenema bharatensis]|uniref:magnesium transporter n=1 Tax=Egbenema bharatensis TaxID=3463334 RepID=UPI003A8C83BA
MSIPSELNPPSLQKLSPSEAAVQFQDLSFQEQIVALQDLSPTIALELYQNLREDQQQQLVQHLRQSSLGAILSQQESGNGDNSPQGSESREPIDQETDYFQISVLQRAAKRIVWLVVLLLANTATTAVIHAQESVLQQVVALAAFIPLLIGSGGNVSTQSATVIVRALSQEEVNWRVSLKRVVEQTFVSILLGLVLGAVVTGIAIVLEGEWDVAIVIGISLFAVAVIAAVSGSILPYCFKALGFDPALMSAPVSSVVVDILGVWVYLKFARWMLHLT